MSNGSKGNILGVAIMSVMSVNRYICSSQAAMMVFVQEGGKNDQAGEKDEKTYGDSSL